MRFERLNPWQGGDRKKGRGIRTKHNLYILIHLHTRKKINKNKGYKGYLLII